MCDLLADGMRKDQRLNLDCLADGLGCCVGNVKSCAKTCGGRYTLVAVIGLEQQNILFSLLAHVVPVIPIATISVSHWRACIDCRYILLRVNTSAICDGHERPGRDAFDWFPYAGIDCQYDHWVSNTQET
jgi:hypothetical protein